MCGKSTARACTTTAAAAGTKRRLSKSARCSTPVQKYHVARVADPTSPTSRSSAAGGKVFIVNGQPTPLDDFAVARYDDLQTFADAVLAM